MTRRQQPPVGDEAISPYDNAVAGGLRFFTELLAWFGGAYVLGSLVHPVLGVLAGVTLIAVTAIFSTPNDRKLIIVPTPGPVRLLLELGLHAFAVWVAWTITPMFAADSEAAGSLASGATVVVGASLLFGWRRFLWLLRGAPLVDPATIKRRL